MRVEEIKKYLSDQFHLPIEQVETMMPSFISTLSTHMETLEDAVTEKDPGEIGKAGHTIKGAFLNLGLTECARIALEIEQSGKAGKGNTDYKSKVDSLYRCLEPVLK